MTGYPMLQTPASFTPLMAPQQDAAPLSFVFHGGRLLVREADLGLPDEAAVRSLALDPPRLQPVGLLEGRYCQTAWVDDEALAPSGYAWRGLRSRNIIICGYWSLTIPTLTKSTLVNSGPL